MYRSPLSLYCYNPIRETAAEVYAQLKISDHFTIRKGRLTIGGRDIEEIASTVGSPCYIYDATIMRKRYRTLRSGLPKKVAIHYSLKANPNGAIASVFAHCGSSAEVASGAELSVALAAGFKPERIIFAGPGKSDADLRLAIKKRIGSINVESERELARIIALVAAERTKRPPQKIALRVNPAITVTNAKGHIMAGGARKFGVDEAAILPLLRHLLAAPEVRFTGFHCFAGTQILESRVLANFYKRFAHWAIKLGRAENITIPSLNFGGGLGIPFADTDKELSLPAVGKALGAIQKKMPQTRLLLEPGRYLVGPSGFYLSRIIDIKISNGEKYLITNGGIHHALLPIVMNKNYPSALVTKLAKRRTEKVTVAGPLCSSADQLSRVVTLPPPAVGDLYAIFNSGAYGYTAGMLSFLSHPGPAEVLVEGEDLYLIRPRRLPEKGIRRKITP